MLIEISMEASRLPRFARSTMCALLLAGCSASYAQITDSGIYPPPSSGTFGYNSFRPGTVGFPAVGGIYTDPVFGSVVRRLTNVEGSRNPDEIYAHHWSNADGSFAFAGGGAGVNIVRVATGQKVYTGQPDGLSMTEIHWDALDPDKYYYLSGAKLMRRNLSAQTDTLVKTFPSTLQANGGSLNIQTRDGRFFTVRYGGTNKVWDSQSDIIYSGAVTPLDAQGWVSITPDGNYIVTAAGPTSLPQKEHHSYPIDHTTRTIGSTPTQFWGLCGDHGVLVSASDGKNYFVTFECNDVGAVYRVDITKNQAGRSAAQQRADNRMLIPVTWDDSGHFCAVSKGPFANWAFASIEANDPFNSSTSGWYPYKQEILAINVVTLEVRRLAHHRSRGLNVDYSNQPRVSCAWDGSVVMWASNFNVSSPTGYADLYAIQNPLGTPAASLSAPTNLRVVQ